METNKPEIKDYEIIRQVLNAYVEGGKRGKSSIMKSGFHPQAMMYGHLEGKLFGGPIQILFDFIDTNPPAQNLRSEITKIDVVGQIAQAKVENYDWNGARYTDMFQLVKDGEEWKILVKEFHSH